MASRISRGDKFRQYIGISNLAAKMLQVLSQLVILTEVAIRLAVWNHVRGV